MTAATARIATHRPATVTWAVILSVVPALLSVPALFLPGADEIPAAAVGLGIALAVLTLIGAWGLWNCRRWGAWTVGIVTALNVLSSLPPLIDPPSGWIVASVVVLTPPAIVALVLLARRESRAAYR